MQERGAFTVAEACNWLRIGRTRFYELVELGELPIVKLGGKTLVRRADVEALLDRYLVVKPSKASDQGQAA